MAIEKNPQKDIDDRDNTGHDHDIAKTEEEHSDEPRQPNVPQGMNPVHEGTPNAELAHPQPDDGMDSIAASNINPDDVNDPGTGNFVYREGQDAGQHDTRNDRSPSRPNTDLDRDEVLSTRAQREENKDKK